jgi:hypothetical protein
MSVNKYLPHVLVLPEDDANMQLANGFHLHVPLDRQRQMQVLQGAGGWREVLNLFESEHAIEMERCHTRFMVLLIDMDNIADRLDKAKARIPPRLIDRVFVLGTFTEPEGLKADLGAYETIGLALAKDCQEGTDMTWRHELLQHNAVELERLYEQVRPILFPPI